MYKKVFLCGHVLLFALRSRVSAAPMANTTVTPGGRNHERRPVLLTWGPRSCLSDPHVVLRILTGIHQRMQSIIGFRWILCIPVPFSYVDSSWLWEGHHPVGGIISSNQHIAVLTQSLRYSTCGLVTSDGFPTSEELSLVVWQLRAWFTIGCAFLILEPLFLQCAVAFVADWLVAKVFFQVRKTSK